MKRRNLLSLRCSCGVYFTENDRGLKRRRCAKCGRSVYRADTPMAAIAVTFLTKKVKSLLVGYDEGATYPRNSGVPMWGEYVRLRRSRMDAEALRDVADRFARSVAQILGHVRLDIGGLDCLMNDIACRPKHVTFAWKARGERRGEIASL